MINFPVSGKATSKYSETDFYGILLGIFVLFFFFGEFPFIIIKMKARLLNVNGDTCTGSGGNCVKCFLSLVKRACVQGKSRAW